MMLQVPAFPVAPVTTDGSAKVPDATVMQQVPKSGIPAATTEFVKPSPRTQDTGSQSRNPKLNPGEKAVVERFSSSPQHENGQGSSGSNLPPMMAPPENLSEVTVGDPPTYRFHRTPDGNLYALSGRQSDELAPVPGNAYATMHKMRLVGAKASRNPVPVSTMMAHLAGFQGRTAAAIAQRNQQRAVAANAKQSNAVMAKVAQNAEHKGEKLSVASSLEIKHAHEAFARSEAHHAPEAQRTAFKVKLKTAKPVQPAQTKPKTVSADKVAIKAKMPARQTVASTSKKVAAFAQFSKPALGVAPTMVKVAKAA